MKVFSKEKYLKRCREMGIEPSKLSWPDRCDGMPVVGERCISCDGVSYGMCDTWCIDVPETVNCRCAIVKEENTMYTMKDFINKPIAVRVGQEHKVEFLKMCEAEGLKWMDGTKAMMFIPSRYGDKLAIAYNYTNQPDGLGYADVPAYRDHGATVIDFKDIKPTEPRYQIIIDCDGKTTTAKMLVDGKEVKTGVAKYNPADKFDFAIGARYAFDRLWGKPEPVDPVKFKVGDRVKCISVPDGNKKVVGKYGTVQRVTNDCRLPILVDFDEDIGSHANDHRHGVKPGCGWWCHPQHLELAKDEPIKAVDPFPFKVGDRVVCTNGVGCTVRVKGVHGTVRDVEDGWCHVEFDRDIGGHTLDGKCKDGYGLLCPFGKLKLEYREVKRHAKAGEWVKIVKPQGWGSEKYKKGDILKVKSEFSSASVILSCGGVCALDREYVVLEGYEG